MILFDGLVSGMFAVLEFYSSFAGPLAALALLSLTVFVVMLPLYKFGDKLLNREKKRKAKMQEELDSLRALSSGNRKYFYTQEIYRRHGYSPLYSLLGLFGLAVQLPFFLAAYHMLHEYQAFSGLAAGPFANLAQPDALLQFSSVTINLLPLLMTIINLLAAYYYAQTPQEKKNIWLFPTLFLLLLYQQAAALVFYWTMNNVFSLLKNLWQKRATSPQWWAIPELKFTQLFSRKALALHFALLCFAVLLGLLYFVDSDKDKEIPSLWINSSLLLLLYLNLYYLHGPQKKQNNLKPRIIQILLLLASLGALFLLLRLHYLAAATKMAETESALPQLLALRMQIQNLRPIAWLFGFAAVLFGCIRSKALLCPQKLDSQVGNPVWTYNLRGPFQRNCYLRYMLSFACIFTAVFWTVPARAIASDPSTFEGNANFLLLTANLLLFCLVPLAVMALLYLVLPAILRYYSSCLAAVAAWFFSLNVLLFPGNYGPMEFTSFRTPLEVSANAMAVSALLLGVLVFFLLTAYLNNLSGKLDAVLILFLILHSGSILLSIYRVGHYHLDVAEAVAVQKRAMPERAMPERAMPERAAPEKTVPEGQPKVQLSATGRNVVILMLDKFMGGLVPDILQANPGLAQRLDGFIFYPNAVSQAQRTYGGFHPIVGGSEYTVDKLNAKQRPLAVDIIEAFTMIPKALRDLDFASYFVNVEYVIAPRARGTMLQRLAEEEVRIVKTDNDYDLLPNPELARGGNTELKWQNFLGLLGLFQGFGPIFREKIYNHGRWMGMLGNSSSWASLAFWIPYIQLLRLDGLFEPDEQLTGAYVLYHNHLPHNSNFVDSYNYFGNSKNFQFPLPQIPQKLLERDASNGNQNLETLFLANYETLYLVVDWLENLKELGLYDNTSIYLVSDHGSTSFDPSFRVQNREDYRRKSNWHSLYMHKDFGARGPLQTTEEFRTVADVPAEFLPRFGIVKNPYSGKTLEPVRTEPIPLYVVEGIRSSEELVGNDRQYYIHEQYNLYNRDIFSDANWEAAYSK